MGSPTLIYCAAGNARFAQIALEEGYKCGGRLPDTLYFPPFFVDQDWKDPVRSRYMVGLEKHHPNRATVLDLERPDQLSEVLSWAEEAAQYVEEAVIIIPKVSGIIPQIPRSLGGKQVILGYSVPTKYGGTVHLLGGSPGKQMYLSRYLDISSVDGNMWQKMALRLCAFWEPGVSPYSNHYTQLREIGEFQKHDAIYTAFRHSCINIRAAWDQIGEHRPGSPLS